MKKELLYLNWLTKSFNGQPVLKYINFNIFEGEIFAVIGHNAAGKSTLLKVLSGGLSPDSGNIYYQEQKISLRSHLDGMALGIYSVPSAIEIIPDMTVFENVYLGLLETRGSGFLYHRKKAFQKVAGMIAKLSLPISPNTLGYQLNTLEKYYVEILWARLNHVRLLLADEPFISLNNTDTAKLKKLFLSLRRENISIIFTSHKITDIHELADRICILKSGKSMMVLENTFSYTVLKDSLIHLLAEPPHKTDSPPRSASSSPQEVLRLEHYCIPPDIADISFSLYQNEILGITGLESAALNQLMDSVWGLYPHQRGNLYLNDEPIKITNPRHALKNKIAYMSDFESTHPQIIHSLSILENFSLSYLPRISPQLFIRSNVEDYLADQYKDFLPTPQSSWKSAARNLSYGVAKKLALARWFCTHNKVLMLNEPFKGLDLNSRRQIIDHLKRLAEEGTSIIIKSVDFDDVSTCTSRVLVLNNGQLQGELCGNEITTGNILTLALQNSD